MDTLSLQFKTIEPTGLLFHTQNSGDKLGDHVTLELVGGRLRYVLIYSVHVHVESNVVQSLLILSSTRNNFSNTCTLSWCSLAIGDQRILCLLCRILWLNFTRSLKELCSFIIILLLYTVLLLHCTTILSNENPTCAISKGKFWSCAWQQILEIDRIS